RRGGGREAPAARELDTPRGGRRKVEADVGGAELARRRDVPLARQAAHLDIRHRPSSRKASSGSSARRSASPTRNACQPTAARRCTSAREEMPLSASRIGPSGMREASPSREETSLSK